MHYSVMKKAAPFILIFASTLCVVSCGGVSGNMTPETSAKKNFADSNAKSSHLKPASSETEVSHQSPAKHPENEKSMPPKQKVQRDHRPKERDFRHGWKRLVLVPASSDGSVICSPGDVEKCVRKCEQGMAAYCYAVGQFYEPLFMKDEHTQFALFGFQKACEAGISDACVALGSIFYNGRLVPPQHEKAYHFSQKACDLKNSAGCANAARFAARGIGVSQNASLAKTLYDKACQLGHGPSCTDYDILEKKAPTPTDENSREEASGFADPRQTNGTDVAWVMCSTLESCDADLMAKIFTSIDFCVSQFNSSTFSTRKCRRFSPESATQCIQDIRALECNAFVNTLFNRVPQPASCDEMCK